MANSKFLVIEIVLAVAALVGAVFFFMPPFFIELGRHYIGGTGLASVSGIYRCADEVVTPECEPIRENLVVAIGNDPDIRNWWPIRVELIRFPESYD